MESAINPTELQVKFNTAVDSATARDLSNYVVSIPNAGGTLTEYGEDGAAAGDLASILDGSTITGNVLDVEHFDAETNTVTFKLASAFYLGNADKYSVDVRDGVLTKDKTAKVAKYTDSTKVFTDNQVAKLVEVTRDGDDLVLEFNEPVKSLGAVKVDDVTVSSSTTSITNVVGDYTVVLSGVLADDQYKTLGEHSVVVYSVEDHAVNSPANITEVVTGTYTNSVDTVAPTVQKIEQVNGQSRVFDITFSENVSVATVSADNFVVKKGNHTLDLVAAGSFTGDATATSANYKVEQRTGKVWRVTVSSDLTSAGNATANPLYGATESSTALSVTLKGYKDVANNVGAEHTVNVTLAKDLTAPAIKSGLENKINTSNQLEVKFDKAITLVDKNKVTVKDKDGFTRTVSNVTVGGTDNDVLLVALDGFSTADLTDKAPFTVTVAAGAVESTSEKVLNNNTSTVIKASSTAAPVVAGVSGVTPTSTPTTPYNGVIENNIVVPYLNEMGPSAAELSNYTLDGKALPSGSTISIDNDNKVVTIKLPEGFAKVANQKLFKISSNVKTKTGSSIVANEATKAEYTASVELADNTQPVLNKAEYLVTDLTNASETKRVKLTFSENVTNADADDLKITVNGATKAISSTAVSTSDNKVIIVTLTDDLALANAATVNVVKHESATNASQSIKDAAGNVAKDVSVTLNTKTLDVDALGQTATDLATAQAAVNGATVNGATTATVTGITSDLTLAGTGVTWTSSNTAVIDDDGTVVRPAYAAGDATVTLTATATVNDQTVSKDFTVTVTAEAASTDATITGVTVAGENAVFNVGSGEYDVELPNGTDLTAITPAQVVAATTDSNASAVATTADNGATWTVEVTAEDGSTVATYTINVTEAP